MIEVWLRILFYSAPSWVLLSVCPAALWWGDDPQGRDPEVVFVVGLCYVGWAAISALLLM